MTADVDFSIPSGRYVALSDEDKARVHDWFELHAVDPTLVPLGSPIALDAEFREWRFETFVRSERDGAAVIKIGPAPEYEPVRRVVRRRMKALPPWVVDDIASRVEAAVQGDSSGAGYVVERVSGGAGDGGV